jgi:hypothetical protein
VPTKSESLTLETCESTLMRTAYVPTLVRVTDDPDYVDEETILGTDDRTAAKLGGAPFLSQEAPAPRCGKCKRPLRFVLQLRRDELPEPARATWRGALLQVFWCDDCQSGGGAENPWSKSALIREVELTGPITPVPRNDEDEEDEHEALAVTFIRDWREVRDYPSPLVKELGAALGLSSRSAAIREQLEALADAMHEAELGPQEGLKIGGWPRWVSEPETLKCKCKAIMSPSLQLGEAVAVGDCGSTWVAFCGACGKSAYLCQQ